MTDEYDPEVNVIPVLAVIKTFGKRMPEDGKFHKAGDYKIAFGRLLTACADGMHMDSINGTLKRAGGKSRDSPYRKDPKLKFKGTMLMYPGDKDRIIRLIGRHAPSDEECKKCRTAEHCGVSYGIEDAAKALKEKGLSLEPCLGKSSK